MSIKILGIHSSPRDGATAAALRYALQCASEIDGVETEFIELRKGGVQPCIHCDTCIKKNLFSCPVFQDAVTPLYEKIREANGIILASPVYDMAPSALMAALIGRMRPLGKTTSMGEWGSKVGLSIAVGGSRNGGEETTLSVLNRYFLALGMNIAGAGVYAYSGASVWSHNHHGNEVIQNDEQNRMNISVAAHRMALMAKVIQTGISDLSLKGFEVAGFLTEEDKKTYLDAFWKTN